MQSFPIEKQREVLEFVESIEETEKPKKQSPLDKLEAISNRVPDDIWEKLPSDGAKILTIIFTAHQKNSNDRLRFDADDEKSQPTDNLDARQSFRAGRFYDSALKSDSNSTVNKMDKLEFISRRLAKAENKKYEHYVVTRIWHLLDNTQIKLVTQQYVTRPSRRRCFVSRFAV